MDNKTLYEGLVLSTFYMRYREKKGMNKTFSEDSNFNSKKVKNIFDKSVKSVLKLDVTLGIVGKEQSNEKVYNCILSALQSNGRISDEDFLNLLKDELGVIVDDRLLNNLIEIVKADGVVSREEKELLLKLYEEQLPNLSSSEKGNLRKELEEKLKIKQTKGQRISSYVIYILTALVFIFIGFFVVRNYLEKKRMESFNIEKYIVDNPRLVFKTVSFSKYLIQGTSNDAGKHSDILNIFHLKGEADLYVELNRLVLIEEETDYLSKKIVFEYNCPTEYPICVDVNVPSDGYTELESIDPEPISKKEANIIALKTAIGGSILGVIIGGKIAGWDGVLPAAGGTAIATFIATRHFVLNFPLPENSISKKETLLIKSQELIALEIIGGNMIFNPDKNSELRIFYENEFRKQLLYVMQQFGWKEVEVRFVYNNQNIQL